MNYRFNFSQLLFATLFFELLTEKGNYFFFKSEITFSLSTKQNTLKSKVEKKFLKNEKFIF